MDNASKAIMIGVGLFITVIIISAVLVVVNLGTGAMNNATNSMGDMLGTLTTPADWNGRENITADAVNNLLKAVEQGKFKYPVTTVVYDAAAVAPAAQYAVEAVRSTSGSGYTPNARAVTSKDALGLNPTYARIGNDFLAFGRVGDNTTTAAAGKEYKAYVIQSDSNSQIGVVLVRPKS